MAEPIAQFGGEERFSAEPARLYAVLTDPDALAATIPGLVSAERSDEQTLQCVVRPGFAFLRGTLKLSIALADLNAPESAAMHVTVQGIGVLMRISSRSRIVPEAGGSRLFWEGRIDEMSGLIATVSPGLVRAAAEATIRHGWQRVREWLGE